MPLFLIAAWSPMLLQQPQLCVLTTPAGQGGGGQEAAAAGPLLQGAAGATTRVSLSPALIGHGRSCRVGSLQTRPVGARQQFSALQNLPSAGLQGPTGVNLNFNS